METRTLFADPAPRQTRATAAEDIFPPYARGVLRVLSMDVVELLARAPRSRGVPVITGDDPSLGMHMRPRAQPRARAPGSLGSPEGEDGRVAIGVVVECLRRWESGWAAGLSTRDHDARGCAASCQADGVAGWRLLAARRQGRDDAAAPPPPHARSKQLARR